MSGEVPDKNRQNPDGAGWRTFIAVTLDEACLAQLARLQSRLRQAFDAALSGNAAGALRWTRREGFHLTLRFLGDITPEQGGQLQAALAPVCANAAPFRLRVEGLGCFPHERNPRVLWAGIGGAVESLRVLQARIERASAPFGAAPEERTYHPHLTLARVKTFDRRIARRIGETLAALPLSAVTLLDNSPGEGCAWTVREVVLMRSELSSHGAKYSILAAFPFSSGAS